MEGDYISYWWDNLTSKEMESHLNKLGTTLDDFELDDIHDAFDNAHPNFIYPN